MFKSVRIHSPQFDQLNVPNKWDFMFDFSGAAGPPQFDVLTIIGSFDFCYYHEVEIRFHDIHYISCPTSFTDAQFGLAPKSESDKLRYLASFDDDTQLFCITVDASADDASDHFIAASHVEVAIKHVGYNPPDSPSA